MFSAVDNIKVVSHQLSTGASPVLVMKAESYAQCLKPIGPTAAPLLWHY